MTHPLIPVIFFAIAAIVGIAIHAPECKAGSPGLKLGNMLMAGCP